MSNQVDEHGLALSSADAKPRLKWTRQLHRCFVDAVSQLGGTDSELLLSNEMKLLAHQSHLMVFLSFFSFKSLLSFSPILLLNCRSYSEIGNANNGDSRDNSSPCEEPFAGTSLFSKT